MACCACTSVVSLVVGAHSTRFLIATHSLWGPSWCLQEGASLRDAVLRMRADEASIRAINMEFKQLRPCTRWVSQFYFSFHVESFVDEAGPSSWH